MRTLKAMTRILPILVLFLTAGCGEEHPELSVCNPEKHFPLDPGNYWIYNTFRKFDDGTIEYRATDSLYVSSDTLMLGYRFYHLEGSFNAHPEKAWLTSKNGAIISSDQNIYYECPQFLDSRELRPVAHFDLPAIISTNRKDTTISVHAGDYGPVMLMEARSMIEDTIPVVTYKFYFARDIGLIKFTARSRTHNFEGISELVRFNLN
jgi:hypothetical protein